ncbi:MAG: LysM peptidoglycan-binding domain-containing protein [Chitinophagales bacterium]
MKKIALCFLFASGVCFSFAQSATHKVMKGETLYAIAKKYGVKVEQLVKVNKIGEDLKVKPGQVLTIPNAKTATAKPVATPVVKTEPASPNPAASKPAAKPLEVGNTVRNSSELSTENIITHEVKKGETAYSIARNYGIKVSTLRELNGLNDSLKVKVGQKILVRLPDQQAMYNKPVAPVITEKSDKSNPVAFTPPTDVVVEKKEPVKAAESVKEVVSETSGFSIEARDKAIKEQEKLASKPAEPVNPDDYEAVYNSYAATGKGRRIIRGLGSFLSADSPGNQFLALYNYAEVGAVVKITNLMSKKTIYVKVIGRVPATDAQNEIVLKVSAQAADVLKVSEEKFLVEVAAYNN